jgi:hypothetical protein
MRHAPFLASVLILLLLGLGTPAASASEIGANERLDHALEPGDDVTDVVAGRIAKVQRRTEGSEVDGLEIVAIDLEVKAVVLGSRDLEGTTLALDTSSFDWPQGLVRPEVGTPCIIVLRENGREGTTDICTVVPARDQALERAADPEGAKRILAREILAALAAERDPGRQRQLILLASPILTAQEATALEPYLGSGDVWLRRAALAGLVHATRRPGFLAFAALDIRRFLETTGPDDMVEDFKGPGISSAPYPLLFNHYFFLNRNDIVPEHLPLWRLVAAGMKGDEWTRYYLGVVPLCRVGTDEDLAFLREYRAAVERGDGNLKELHERPLVRQEILLGLARIVGLDLPSYVERDFIVHEAEQVKQVMAALEAHDKAR